MLRLRLWNFAETAQYDIELYESAPVNLKFQFTNVSKVNKTVGGHSQTFRVPATESNLNFFGAVIHPQVETDGNQLINGTWNVKKKIRAELSYQTVPVMTGTVQVKSIVRQKKNFYDIELVFFGEAIDLASSIGQDMLSDLDLTALDITMNYTAFLQGMFMSGSSPLDGDMLHGIIDRGQNWSGPFDGTAQNGQNLYQSDLTPFVRARYLFNKILTTAGYSYDSTFLDSTDFGKIYMPMFSGGNRPQTDDDSDNRAYTVIGTSTGADQTTTNTTDTLLQMHHTGMTYGMDNGSNVTESSTYKWTAPYGGYVAFYIRTTQRNAQVILRHTKAAGGTDDIVTITNPVFDGVHFIAEAYSFQIGLQNFFMNSGDYLQLYFKTTAGNTATVHGGTNALGASSRFQILAMSQPVTGFDYDMKLNVPEIKQIEFLSSLQTMFNLIIVPDKINPKKLKIEPFKDYMSSGTVKDWTDKIDFTKDVVLKPTTDLQKSKYIYSHAEGQDFINKAIKDQQGRVYGTKKIEDEDNDYAKGEQKFTTFTAPYTVTQIPNNGFPAARLMNAEGEVIKKPKARFAYYNGIATPFCDQNNPIYLNNDSASPQMFTIFPTFTNVNSLPSEPSTKDLNFGAEVPMIPNESHGIHNLYYEYWTGYIAELFSDDARIMECFMYLNKEDIATFEWNDKIQIENTQYRILEISGFDATQESICKVKLIKILSDIADCADTPTDITDGVVTFNSSATDYGSQVCCEKYGFIWTPDKAGGNSRCRALGEIEVPEGYSNDNVTTG